jgi:hypothetical protein
MKTSSSSLRSSALPLAAGFALLASAGCSGAPQDGERVGVSVEQALTTQTIGTMQYFKCAAENGTCTLGQTKLVAFGANGSYFYKNVGGNVSCSTSVFGDPLPNVVKACYFAPYTQVAVENGEVTIGGSIAEIAFGANGAFNYQEVAGNVPCNVANFGDPAPGVVKACYRALPEYVEAGDENQTMTLQANSPVAFGGHGLFRFAILSGSQPCTPATFGGDPSPNDEWCYQLAPDFGRLATEGQSYTAQNDLFAVSYGSGLNDNFLVDQTHRTQLCNSASFGGDPDNGDVKSCWQTESNNIP